MEVTSKRERHPFTPEEDKKLIGLVNRFGEKSWTIISSFMVNRTVRQCRDRWTNSLCGNIIKGEWSTEEDALLLKLYKEYGSRWKTMEKFFPGRAQYDIRNHCKSIVRQKMYAINFLNQNRSSVDKKNIFNIAYNISKSQPAQNLSHTSYNIADNANIGVNANQSFSNEKILINNEPEKNDSNIDISNLFKSIDLNKIDPILIPYVSEPMLLNIP